MKKLKTPKSWTTIATSTPRAPQEGASLALEQGALRALTAICKSDEEPHVCAVVAAAIGAICAQGQNSAPLIASERVLQVHPPLLGVRRQAHTAQPLFQACLPPTMLAKRPLGPMGLKKARTGLSKIIQACDSYADLVWVLETIPLPENQAQSAGDSHVRLSRACC